MEEQTAEAPKASQYDFVMDALLEEMRRIAKEEGLMFPERLIHEVREKHDDELKSIYDNMKEATEMRKNMLTIATHFAPVIPPEGCVWEDNYTALIVCNCSGPGFASSKKHFKLRKGAYKSSEARYLAHGVEAEAEWGQFMALYNTFTPGQKEAWAEMCKPGPATFVRFLKPN